MKTIHNTHLNARKLAAAIASTGVTPVFDLDGVLIDASHRQICNSDGSLNLDMYRKNSTFENIQKDANLPLIETINMLNDHEIPYHVCTARVPCNGTRALLKSRGIKPVSIMGRQGETDSRRDHVLKTDHLTTKFCDKTRAKMVLIDDNLDNCIAAKRIGMKAINIPFTGH